jgi:hypothetical protein
VKPLDLQPARPRPVRALRAELPRGNRGEYIIHEAGLSRYVVRRAGLEMDRFPDAVATARQL